MSDLDLDHPRLTTRVRTSAEGTSPMWEVTAKTVSGNELPFNGESGDQLILIVDELLDEPTIIAHIDLTLWFPA